MEEFASRRKDGWTAEQDRVILDMRERRLPWKQIAEAAGRTVEGCCGRYRTLVPAATRTRHQSLKRWTDEEEAILSSMLAERKTVNEIAAVLGRTTSMVSSKIYFNQRPTRRIHVEMVPRVYVPPECVVDRDRRFAAERDLTAEFFGDPPKGFSALDRKQGAFA